jgi:hypothetical protein
MPSGGAVGEEAVDMEEAVRVGGPAQEAAPVTEGQGPAMVDRWDGPEAG